GGGEGKGPGRGGGGYLAGGRAGRAEDLDAAPARDVDAARRVDLDAVRESGDPVREDARVREPAVIADVEREHAARAVRVVVARGVDGAAVADVERALVGRERQPVGLVEAVADEPHLARPPQPADS